MCTVCGCGPGETRIEGHAVTSMSMSALTAP